MAKLSDGQAVPKWKVKMKASMCDLCGQGTPVDAKDAMAYDVAIFAADGFEAETKKEKAMMLEFNDLCVNCATIVRKTLIQLKSDLSRKKK